jgi:hypothetical protein
MSRVVVILALATVLLVPAAPAQAAAEWCEQDPLAVIITPRGAIVPVFVTTGARGLEHLPAVLLAEIRYSAEPTRFGEGTIVKMDVFVRDDLFAERFETRTTVSSGPLKTGEIHGETYGESGSAMRVRFRLDVP